MRSIDDVPEAIQWHEGMLLASPHFQQLAARSEDLVYYHAALASPFHWGVCKIKVDENKLVSGIYGVIELEAILPDGLVVRHTAEDPLPELDLTPHKDAMRQTPGTIHLTVKARRAGESSQKGEDSRLRVMQGSNVAKVIDDASGEGEIQIPRLRPRARLWLGDPPPKYIGFPIARVQYKDEGFKATEHVYPHLTVDVDSSDEQSRARAKHREFQFKARDYVYPHLTVDTDSPIHFLCNQLAKNLRKKAMILAEKGQSPGLPHNDPLLLQIKTQVSNLVASLPQFEALVNTGVSHPFHLYLSLCSLVGQASSLGSGLVPPVLPAYNHADIHASFKAAIEYIGRMLEEGILESYRSYPFVGEGAGVFTIGFYQPWVTRQLVLGVRGRPGMTESDIIAWMDESLIGPKDAIPRLRENRTRGTSRTRVDRDRDLVPTRGVVLFSLKFRGDEMANSNALDIVNVADQAGSPRITEIILYVKRERE